MSVFKDADVRERPTFLNTGRVRYAPRSPRTLVLVQYCTLCCFYYKKDIFRINFILI
jgi:hypothetical protein